MTWIVLSGESGSNKSKIIDVCVAVMELAYKHLTAFEHVVPPRRVRARRQWTTTPFRPHRSTRTASRACVSTTLTQTKPSGRENPRYSRGRQARHLGIRGSRSPLGTFPQSLFLLDLLLLAVLGLGLGGRRGGVRVLVLRKFVLELGSRGKRRGVRVPDRVSGPTRGAGLPCLVHWLGCAYHQP